MPQNQTNRRAQVKTIFGIGTAKNVLQVRPSERGNGLRHDYRPKERGCQSLVGRIQAFQSFYAYNQRVGKGGAPPTRRPSNSHITAWWLEQRLRGLAKG